jgi:23S rRNA pseudouridine1911/1915/1917 synthase
MDEPVIEASEAGPGQRLDRFLADRLGISRARVRHLLDHGRIRCGDRALLLADKSRVVASGERFVLVGARRAEDERPRPRPDLPLEVVAEGEGWIVVDKPAGRGVHPLHPEQDDTVLNALCARRPEILGIGEGGLRSGVVHRLDVETSGALLFATTPETWRRLRGAFSDHRIEKRYRAIVEGDLARERRVDLPLETTRHRPARVRVREGGRPCRLHVRPLQRLRDATLVEVALETGFLHQIRASLAHLGHPVVGDAVYGGGGGAVRPMLHARSLRLGEIDVVVDPPEDFRTLLEQLASAEAAAD